MESFRQIKNEYILKTCKQNRLKTVVKEVGINNSTLVYGQKFLVPVSRRYNGLAQAYLQIDITRQATAAAATTASGIAAKIFDSIRLITESGTCLQRLTPEYTIMRITEFSNAISDYERINPSLDVPADPADPFNSTTGAAVSCTVYLPLFFFFSEHKDNFLMTRSLEQLYIELTTTDSASKLGIESPAGTYVPLTKIVPTVHFMYYDDGNTSLNEYIKLADKPNLPKVLKGSYNTFYEEPVSVLAGATSARVLVRCNYPLFNITAFLFDSSRSRKNINTMSMSVRGNYIFRDFSNKINYSFFSADKGFSADEAFSYWFCDSESRTNVDSLITFSSEDSFFPCYLEVTFDLIGSNGTLYVFSDYLTEHHVTNTGKVIENANFGKLQFNVS